MKIREAEVTDIKPMHRVRISVHENVLADPSRITEKDYEEYLTKRGKGWICEINEQVVGFAVVDLVEKNIWALFVHPDFEQKGIGSALHNTMLGWYFSNTDDTVWLGTAPGTRAEMFYLKMGWKKAGYHAKDEVKFEMSKQGWLEMIRPYSQQDSSRRSL